jgi:murein DD-endopeptidase MepM/ murein hydrolase activator NlpD
LRQRGAIPDHPKTAELVRRVATTALVVWLACSILPFTPGAVFAAPPDSETVENVLDPLVPTGSAERTDAAPSSPHQPENASKLTPRSSSRSSSVRRRGLEAPVQLLPRATVEPTPEVEDGDGTPPAERAGSPTKQQASKQDERSSLRKARDIRVWPMRAKTYTFTQRFGCVPQIANFYLPGDGCPPDRPVVHTGVDLAAPEGTPFYAAAAGWVTASGYDRDVGVPNTRIIIQHVGRNDGYATEYLHWIASYVKVGDYVEAGQMIGEVGSVGYSTGPHLHFSVVDLDSGEPIDPIGWLPKRPGTEGYRGLAPHTRASMRLPAGTTAGLPETADPSPPPPPVRQHVPDASPDKSKKHRHKHKRQREERRAARADSSSGDQAADGGDESAAIDHHRKSKAKGKDKERTRTRERNKDGKTSETTDSGENGSSDASSSGSTDNTSPEPKKKAKHHDRSNSGHNSPKNRKNDSGHSGQKNKDGKKDGNKKGDEGGGSGDGDSGSNADGEKWPGRPIVTRRDRGSPQTESDAASSPSVEDEGRQETLKQ